METVEMEGLHDSDYISFPTYGRRQQSESRIFHVTFSNLTAGTSRIEMREILLYFQSCIGQYLVQVKPGLNVASEAYKRLEFVPPRVLKSGINSLKEQSGSTCCIPLGAAHLLLPVVR